MEIPIPKEKVKRLHEGWDLLRPPPNLRLTMSCLQAPSCSPSTSHPSGYLFPASHPSGYLFCLTKELQAKNTGRGGQELEGPKSLAGKFLEAEVRGIAAEAKIRSAFLSDIPLQGGLLLKAPKTTPEAGADLALRASCIKPPFPCTVHPTPATLLPTGVRGWKCLPCTG